MVNAEGYKSPADSSDVVSPVKLAHFVIRTSRYEEILDWYTTALGAHTVFRNEQLAFLTYDDEHHRIAILNMPGLSDQPDGIVGIHHVAFTYRSLGELLQNFVRLRNSSILPALSINHGPTTSLYYVDPDGNQLEFQVENFETVEESTEFFHSEEFARNPIGVEFDPDDLIARMEAGSLERELLKRPESKGVTLSEVTALR
ncbi:MAG: VOC family protein [Pseudomonadota bacterium]